MEERDRTRVVVRALLASPPEVVYPFLSTETGRTAFWADKAPEVDGKIHLHFSNGMAFEAQILINDPPRIFAFNYFGGSRAEFRLEPSGSGTLLTLEETGIDPAWYADQRAGWVSVLLTLKAAVDFSVDLRNPDPGKSWEQGFVDV